MTFWVGLNIVVIVLHPTENRYNTLMQDVSLYNVSQHKFIS
ncbi:hypothetical protein NIES4075_01580 [Tolypothrix sp. NIES-4075]|nr:hypothetical protein NIES4075_01580 [Tolypothrix sp. NIES-4075]